MLNVLRASEKWEVSEHVKGRCAAEGAGAVSACVRMRAGRGARARLGTLGRAGGTQAAPERSQTLNRVHESRRPRALR